MRGTLDSFMRMKTCSLGSAVCWASDFFRSACYAGALVAIGASALSNGAEPLWQIGKPDQNNAEFALAPNRYGEFRNDGLFVVGQSDAKRDWPYVHPGPSDSWAGGKQHTYSVLFGLKAAPTEGECVLRIDVLDTQAHIPPNLRVALNGRTIQKQLTGGAGDASVYGDPTKGKRQRIDLSFPAAALRAGPNEVAITTTTGSWLLYDSVQFDAPAGLELEAVSDATFASFDSPPVLKQQDGRLMQVINVHLRHFGKETDARVRVAGEEKAVERLRAGASTITVPVPAVEKAVGLEVQVEAGGRSIAKQTVTLAPVRKWVVYLLPHSHVDIGYTHVQTDVERAQWKYLEMAIDTARRTASNPPGAQFKWNVEVLWAVDSYLRQASPEKQAQFVEAVKAGWVGLQALYGNQLTGLCRPEELLRLVWAAQTLSKRIGKPIESAMITDVPGYTWGIVPTFAHSGIKYFSIGPNGGDRIGHTAAAWGDKPFWWIGPNGRDKVLAWMTGTGYYQVFQSPEKLLGYLGQLEARGYPYEFVQVRHCLGDNGAPDVDFADKVKAWNETHAYPKLVIATSDEMFHDFEARYGDSIPQAKGDFTPYWEDGAGSSAAETALNRATADRLSRAETLFALLNPGGYPVEDFYQAWRNTLLYSEHTWGAHNSISQPDEPFVKSQWAIKQAFALDAAAQSKQLIDAAVRTGWRGERVPDAADVINPTCFESSSALVVLPAELSASGNVVKRSLASGEVIPAQRLASGELVFRAPIGPFKTTRFYLSKGASASPAPNSRASAEGLVLRSGSDLELRIDAQTGGIASLRHRGRELVDSSDAGGLNEYFYLPGTDLKGLQRNASPKVTVKERGPVVASLLIESEAPGCRKLTREVRVFAGSDCIEIQNTVDKAPVRTKEGVHFGFSFNVRDAVVRMDVPWAVVRPEEDQIPGACKNWFTVQRWVDVSNERAGITWFTPDAPLVQIGGITANLVGSLSDPRNWISHIEPSPKIYSWAMNNHWHTNYRAEQEGPTLFRYFLFPHQGFNQADAVRQALECSEPLVAVPARGPEPGPSRLRLSNANVTVTAFKPSDDGKASIVRLFSGSGKDEKVNLQWSDPAPASLWTSDTSERPLTKVGGTIDVPAYTIVTLRAEER